MRQSTSFRRWPGLLALGALGWALPAPAEEGSRVDQVLDRIVANEAALGATLEKYRPLVETYLQTVRPDTVLGAVPLNDNYFFGRLELGAQDAEAAGRDGRSSAPKKKKALSLLDDFHSQTFKPEAFARMLTLDRGAFDRNNYQFEFIRAEFLGEVRTLVFDVIPRPGQALSKMRTGRFTGRIWAEDRDWHIVRFNGIYDAMLGVSFHFDSWRLNLAPGLWLPAYVYTEESERAVKQLEYRHKGQTRIWGYAVERPDAEDEFTKVLIDAGQADDTSEQPGRISPVASARAWEREAEENVVGRLERAGLLAPEGPVDEVLETVVGNLEITNGLAIEPPVRCRVLLTTPLESFTVGHTIVLSRGLLDVLPDEGSLALVLAHELGHVLSGHELDTSWAFSDRLLVNDREALERFDFERAPEEEQQADDRAAALLAQSPYKDDLATAGLFLRALHSHANALPALIRPHFGNRMAHRDRPYRMPGVAADAPVLDPTSLEQVAALPLGGRVKLDPWSARIELMKDNRAALLSAREKMPFQVTPLMPYLARIEAAKTPLAKAPAAPQGDEAVVSDRSRH